MKRNKKITKELVLDYIDGLLSVEERNEVEQALIDSPELKAFFDEQQSIHKGLKNLRLMRPRPHFVDNVMEGLDKIPQKELVLKAIFKNRGFLLLMGAALTLLATIYLIKVGMVDLTGLKDFNTQEVYQDLDTDVIQQFFQGTDFNTFLKGFLFFDLFLVFLLFDKIVLKPIFRKRAQMHY
ncbi:MAG: hypothetical protein AAFX87_15915 [Bacteroidota bacterium]